VQHVEVVRRFAAPPERVFEVYTHHEGWRDWAGFGTSRLDKEGSPQRNGSGAVRVLGSRGVNAYEEVLDFEPPKRMTYRLLRGGPIKNHLGEVVFEPDGDGTLVTWRCRFDAKVPGLGPLMRFGISRMFRKALDGLARHAFPDA
jgi:uncharacterized protein YndB with AHSA1/START domain